jgi:hypothetical protein
MIELLDLPSSSSQLTISKQRESKQERKFSSKPYLLPILYTGRPTDRDPSLSAAAVVETKEKFV